MQSEAPLNCSVRKVPERSARERGIRRVVLLTAIMMIVEIGVGYATGSMALLADGWHMATHVGALGLASIAYTLSRRYASHRAFTFGTGKLHALAGYTSAIALGFVALSMIVESVLRWVHPAPIDYSSAIPVAVLGLAVNLVSVGLLHAPDATDGFEKQHAPSLSPGHAHAHASPGHAHAHASPGHAGALPAPTDHNHRAAFFHVLADALTSVLAIGALLAGRHLGWNWLDAASGVVGGVIIVHWGLGLSRDAAQELLDVLPSSRLEEEIQEVLEALEDVAICDLHVWPLGGGSFSCLVTLSTSTPRDPDFYRQALAPFHFAHVTIEVRRKSDRTAAPGS